MKKLLLLLGVIAICLTTYAQSEALFIFEQFHNAKIHFKNRSITIAPMNYDAANDKMYYKDKGNLMELTNAAQIDSIVWARIRTFIPHADGYLEQVKMENGNVFIHWRIKKINVGATGAMGGITQAKVEAINIRSMGVFSAESNRINSADVYQKKNTNEYFLPIDSKLKKITTKKHVYKLFPQHEDNIKEYADKENIKMEEPLSVLQLLNYCMGLK